MKNLKPNRDLKLLFCILMLLTFKFSFGQTNNAYQDNMKVIDSTLVGNTYQYIFAIYSGDITQDGTIDISDFLDIDPAIQNGDGGYVVGDLNGDGAVDVSDFLVLDPNIQGGIGANIPTP